MIPGNANPLLLASAAADDAAAGPIKSVRFNDNDSAHLTRTPSSAGNRRTWTWAAWVKRANLGGYQSLFADQVTGGTDGAALFFTLDNTIVFEEYSSGGIQWKLQTTQVFRDCSAWFHLVVVFNSPASTANERMRIYVNGSEVTDFAARTNPSQNFDGSLNRARITDIASYGAFDTSYFDGYLADIYFIDGSALDPTSFGAFDDSGVWQSAAYSGTYGTNGFHLLDFANESTVGHDSSGNENDWTAVNISTSAGAGNDVLFDAPTNGSQTDTGAGGEVSGNYCTMNPLAFNHAGGTSGSLANGNLEYRNARNSYFGTCLSTISVSSGKWYFEATCVGSSSWEVGIYGVDPIDSRFYTDDEAIGYSATGYGYKHNGQKNNNLSASSYGASYTAGDVIGVALDLDGGTLTFYKNGTSQGTAFSSLSGTFAFAVSASSSNSGWNLNFGQRAFTYQNAGTNRPADTFKAVCTTNLPTPTIADGSDYFDIDLYSGTGASHTRSGFSFSPDWVWIKVRDAGSSHRVFDTVRGAGKHLLTDDSGVEQTHTAALSAFTSDGYTLGANDDGATNVNQSGKSYVGWLWDAGSSTVSNTDGSITSSVRASQTAGFSVVSYTGNNTAGASIGHSLNTVPEFIVCKDRDSSSGWWAVYHASQGNTKGAYLNVTQAFSTQSFWNNTTPTSSVFTVGANANSNANGNDFIAYCFAPVAGYSAFSSFEGSGAADNFVYTGFRSRLVWIKEVDNANPWYIYDTARNTFNTIDNILQANAPSSESTVGAGDGSSQNGLQIFSNGFAIPHTLSGTNRSGSTFIFCAWAENPFQANGGLAR